MIPSALMLSRRYNELKLPVMIIAGSGDLVLDPGHHSGRLHDDVPHSTLRLAPGQGHMLHYAEPAEIVAAIDAMHAVRMQSDTSAPEQRP